MQSAGPELDRYSIAIVKLLASVPLNGYYQREVARGSGVSVGKTNQVLRELETKRFLTKERKGNVDLYRYNLVNPAARYLKIFVDLSRLIG
jgi:hypothetical protein